LAKIWDISWDIWEQRNGIAHDTLHPRRLAQLQVIQQEVKDIFCDGCDDLLSRDKRLFDKGLEKILAGSDIEMRQPVDNFRLACSMKGNVCKGRLRIITTRREIRHATLA
jgi:hypothetical protein